MTIEQISNAYFNRISSSRDKENETIKVINEINMLKYKSGSYISREDKVKIIEAVYSKLANVNEIYILIEKSDNQNYLNMLSSMIQTLKDDTKKD